MVGGDGIGQEAEHAGLLDLADARQFGGHAGEEWGTVDVGALIGPAEDLAPAGLDGPPLVGTRVHIGVLLDELAPAEIRVHDGIDLLLGGPDVAEEDLVAIGIRSQSLRGEVHVHGTSQGVGHDQWR